MRSEFCIQQPKPAQNVSTFYFPNCDQIKCNEEVIIVRIHILSYNLFLNLTFRRPKFFGQEVPTSNTAHRCSNDNSFSGGLMMMEAGKSLANFSCYLLSKLWWEMQLLIQFAKEQNIVDFCSICIHLDKILRLKYFSVRKKRLQRYDLSLPKRASLRVKIATSIVV